MDRIERWRFIFMVAGLACFALAFVTMGWLPWAHLGDLPMKSVEELAAKVDPSFVELSERYPGAFQAAFGKPESPAYARALSEGRDIYIAEGCWHCHSQQVRPVANESLRFGRSSYPEELQNALQLPQMLGTRRVGPDLIRVAGKYSNDWHAAHLWDPRTVVPTSVMPRYPWLFDREEGKPPVPNRKGLSVISYLQWLGSWIPEAERLAP